MKLLLSTALIVSLAGFSVTAEAATKKKAATKTKTPAKATAPAKSTEPAPKAVDEKPAEAAPVAAKSAVPKESSASTPAESKPAPGSKAKSPMRFGIGLGTDLGFLPVGAGSVSAIRLRAEVTPKVVGNFDLGFRNQSGDFGDSTGLGFAVSGQYRVFTNEAQNLHFHVLGGLGYAQVTMPLPGTTATTNDITVSDITLFGGVGAEYFFGGTNQFSMQVDVGPAIHLLSVSPEGSPDRDGVALNLFENLSSGILFSYYFDFAKK